MPAGCATRSDSHLVSMNALKGHTSRQRPAECAHRPQRRAMQPVQATASSVAQVSTSGVAREGAPSGATVQALQSPARVSPPLQKQPAKLQKVVSSPGVSFGLTTALIAQATDKSVEEVRCSARQRARHCRRTLERALHQSSHLPSFLLTAAHAAVLLSTQGGVPGRARGLLRGGGPQGVP